MSTREAVMKRVTIALVVREKVEVYEGTIRDAQGNVLYTVQRWSEAAVRAALATWLYNVEVRQELELTETVLVSVEEGIN